VKARGEDAVREDDDDGEGRTFYDAIEVTPRMYHSSTAACTGRTRRPASSTSGQSAPI
jgi:hypothetical protein